MRREKNIECGELDGGKQVSESASSSSLLEKDLKMAFRNFVLRKHICALSSNIAEIIKTYLLVNILKLDAAVS